MHTCTDIWGQATKKMKKKTKKNAHQPFFTADERKIQKLQARFCNIH